MKHHYTAPKNIRIIQVVEVIFETGDDKTPNNPKREIARYYSPDGIVLAERDPIDDEVFVSE